MTEELLYLDSSAIAKLLIAERGSSVLENRVVGGRLVSSSLATVEVSRAVRRAGRDTMLPDVRKLLSAFELLRPDGAILEHALQLDPVTLRTLDAIHLASALLLGSALSSFIVYDLRLAEAAARAGLRVESPGRSLL